MATTLAAIRNRVRVRINELDNKHPSAGIVAIDGAIADSYILLSSRIPAPILYTASAFTISANSRTFTLPASGAEYAGDVRIQLDSDKTYLKKRTREEIEAHYHGDTSTQGGGRPQLFSLYEDASAVMQGECWPRPASNELCHLTASLTATDLRDAAAMDAASINFSRIAAVALTLYAAANLVAAMSDEDLALRRLNRGVSQLWLNDAERLLYEEEVRRGALENVDYVQRWVS